MYKKQLEILNTIQGKRKSHNGNGLTFDDNAITLSDLHKILEIYSYIYGMDYNENNTSELTNRSYLDIFFLVKNMIRDLKEKIQDNTCMETDLKGGIK